MTDLLEQWCQAASPGWATTTHRETRSLIDHHLVPHLGHLAVAKLTTADIDDFYRHLLKRGSRDERALSPGTVQRVHVVLHRAMAQAVRWDWVWINPASQASPPRALPAEICPPSADAISKLLAHAAEKDRAFYVFLMLAATTGARRGELLALRWKDVDFDVNTLAFQRSLIEGVHGPTLAPTKTRRSHRVVLDTTTADVLRDFFDQHAGTEPDGFVFSSDEDGKKPWLPNRATKTFIRLRTSAGLPHFRLHDLRHFMATQMLDAGVPVMVVAARLAHARASTTLNVYAHAMPGSDLSAAEVLRARMM